MKSSKEPAHKSKIDRELLIWGFGSGLLLFLVLMIWLDYHGYFISPDAIYINVLAKSFSEHPYVIWFKRAYSYRYEIIHHDFTFPPIPPLYHWILDSIGIGNWQRGNWTTAFFMGMTVPAWMWAMAPHFKTQGATRRAKLGILAAGWIATLLLLAQAKNQMWHELYLGIVSPVAVFLFILSYGAYVRENYLLCGLLTGITFLVRFDAQVTLAILVLGHGLAHIHERKRWKQTFIECFQMGISFLAITSPWWIRSLFLGHAPWFNHMVPIFLYGEAGNFRWFPDTDTALGHLIYNPPAYTFYEELVRARWKDLVEPYFGSFFSEAALPGLLLAISVIYAVRRPQYRALTAFIALGAFLRVAVVAGLHDAFNRRYFLIFDACVMTWLTLMLWDHKFLVRNAARAVMLLIVVANWNDLSQVLITMRPYVGYLEGGMPLLADAVKELNTTREPILTAQIEGHALAYYTEHIPIIEIPTNQADAGIMDQYLDRWKIKWTTVGGTIRPHLKTHAVTEIAASNGLKIWKVTPLASTP